MIILSVLAFLVVFSILIVAHEFGHFYAARKCGVKVLEFALGMGKRVFGKKVGETEYNFNAIPFGGFVRMLGEEEKSDDPRSFEKAKLWKRMIITLAGVFMNFVLAIGILTFLFSVGTNPILVSKADLERAVESGLVTLSEPNEEGVRKVLSMQEQKFPLGEAFIFSIKETGRISVAILEKVGEIPIEIIENHRLPEGLSGPVGIAEVTHKIVPMGILELMKLTALLSISLGVFNLLPIPALDGGRFIFQLLELITFRRPNPKWENYVHYAGFMILMGLLVVVTWNDIMRIFFV